MSNKRRTTYHFFLLTCNGIEIQRGGGAKTKASLKNTESFIETIFFWVKNWLWI